MLTRLSIRDVVLIDQLDLDLAPGLTVLTGETGAGKSILLDSLGLALGERAAATLLRSGAEQASVSASFDLATDHPVFTLVAEQGLAIEPGEMLVLRRVVLRDGRSRAFLNDQPVGVALLRQIGAGLVEIQGQHDQMGLADPALHLGLLDAFGVAPRLREAVTQAWRRLERARRTLAEAKAALAQAASEEDWLRHAASELSELAPQPDEELSLAARRQELQQGERRAEAVAAAIAEIAPRDRRNAGPAAALRAASRALHKLGPPPEAAAPGQVEAALAALDRAEEALAEAETLLGRLANDWEADPRGLESTEERLFALRAAARKHTTTVDELPALLTSFTARLASIDSGADALAGLEVEAEAARGAYLTAAEALSSARARAAAKLAAAIDAELAPLRLGRAKFSVALDRLADTGWGARGIDAAQFMIAANPGEPPGPLGRVASGGELSRLMLALKVVLASVSTVPTLVFDEVDSGVGGATAAAVGERLAAVAKGVQTLVVTHSPQVAARAAAHLRIAKSVRAGRTTTSAAPLSGEERREELARMLAGETVTDAARAAADALIAQQQGPQFGLFPTA